MPVADSVSNGHFPKTLSERNEFLDVPQVCFLLQIIPYICIKTQSSMSLEARKYELSSQITLLKDEVEVARFEMVFKHITANDGLLLKLATPMRKRLVIDELVKEQGFKGVDRTRFDDLVAELDVKETIEELLTSISK